MNFPNTISVVKQYREKALFRNIAIRVGKGNKILGDIFSSAETDINENTLFDLAGVTKILSVTMLSLTALEEGRLSIEDKVSKFFLYLRKWKNSQCLIC